MRKREIWHARDGFLATSLGTLVGRVLGLVRDMATASLLGLGTGGVLDALVVAFRVPNLMRRLFGEGALSASFLPVFTAEYEQEPRRAWQLLSVLLTWLTLLLTILTVAGEGVCYLLWRLVAGNLASQHLIALTAALLPYLVLVCLAAQLAAALQARLKFAWPAIASSSLNICWIAAACWVAPSLFPPAGTNEVAEANQQLSQAFVLAAAILLSGVVQVAVQLPALARAGFRFDYNPSASRQAVRLVVRSMLPIALGLGVTQINTLLDSLIAWGLAADDGAGSIPWLPGDVAYPMHSGAASAIYLAERFYQLPVGLLGVAVATVLFPLLSRHAARGETSKIGDDLSLALRFVWFLALPAGVGIMLLSRPFVELLFERGQFTSTDTGRTTLTIACYATGIGAYCALPVLVRSFYAAGQRAAPARIGLAAVGLNLALNLTLVWPLAENGLALATSISALLQVGLLLATFQRVCAPLDGKALRTSLFKTALATGVMSLAVLSVPVLFGQVDAIATWHRALCLGVSIVVGLFSYATCAALLQMPELRLLFAGRLGNPSPSMPHSLRVGRRHLHFHFAATALSRTKQGRTVDEK